jgi:hypothetical protein
LINAPHDKEFIFHDGTRARNLLDIVSKLENLDDHEFHQFVNIHKNDFANWTEHVLSDKPFADKLRVVASRVDAIQLIKDKINDVAMSHSSIGIGIHVPSIEYHSNVDADHNVNHTLDHAVATDTKIPKEISSEMHVEDEKHPKKDASSEIKTDIKVDTKVYTDKTDSKMDVKSNKFSEEKKEKQHERLEESKAGHNWFKFFSRKNLSEKKLQAVESEEEDKLAAENSLKNELVQTERENALWITLYFALVLLIITLLIYKLFL